MLFRDALSLRGVALVSRERIGCVLRVSSRWWISFSRSFRACCVSVLEFRHQLTSCNLMTSASKDDTERCDLSKGGRLCRFGDEDNKRLLIGAPQEVLGEVSDDPAEDSSCDKDCGLYDPRQRVSVVA